MGLSNSLDTREKRTPASRPLIGIGSSSQQYLIAAHLSPGLRMEKSHPFPRDERNTVRKRCSSLFPGFAVTTASQPQRQAARCTATSCLDSAIEKYGLAASNASNCRSYYIGIDSYIHLRGNKKGLLWCPTSIQAGNSSLPAIKLLLARNTCSQASRGHFCTARRGGSHSLKMTTQHGAPCCCHHHQPSRGAISATQS